MNFYKQGICERCNKTVPITDIKYFPKGKDSKIALCPECRELETNIAKKKEKVQEVKRAGIPMQEKDKEYYICSRCDYKFKFGPTSPIATTKPTCPYCGKSESIRKCKIYSASSLLKEPDDF